MKALHFGRFFTSYPGGLERHVCVLLDELSKTMQADNLVANTSLKSDVLNYKNRWIYRAASFGVFASTALAPAMIYKMLQLQKKNRYDIVHLHFPDPLTCICAMFLPDDVKIVITWHSDVARQKFLLKFYQPLVRRILRRADAVIAATPKHFSSSSQMDGLLSEKKHIVPFGIDVSQYRPNRATMKKAKEIRHSVQNRPLVFAVGRHVYYKGFEFLIRSITMTKSLVVILGGTGPLTENLKEIAAQTGVLDRIVFTGKIDDEDLLSYYHACDVFCLPSVEKAEAFGLVQIEAMACRKPVVSCELNNGVTYVNQDRKTGFVVEPKNPQALAAALQKLVGDPALRRRFGNQGYKRVNSEFTIDAMVRGTKRVYESVLGQKVP